MQYEEMTTKDLVDLCMDKFCCIEVCDALGCREMCEEQDCPLWVLLERVRERWG